MCSKIYAGIDVGTSGCKIQIYDLDGNVVFKASETYKEDGEGGYRELNGRVVYEKIKKLLWRTGQKCGKEICALAVAGLGEAVVCVDKDNRILANSIVTGDKRGRDEVEELIEEIGEAAIFEVTGIPPNELYGLPKYIWMNKNTDTIKRAKAIFFYEDYVGYMLTGKRIVSYSSAARSLAFDIRKKEWSERLLSFAGIKKEQMSLPVPAFTVIGTIRPELSEEMGLNPDMKIVVGGHDQTCAAIGSGLKDTKTGECGMGTCEFMFMMMNNPGTSKEMIDNDFTCIPYIVGDTYLTSMEVTTCGILKNWVRDILFSEILERCEREGENFFEYMDRLSKNLQTNILLLPQFGSSGTPDINMNTAGTITGLTVHTKPEEIYRAVLESFAFQMRYSYERLQKLDITEIRNIIATGGGAKSELTLQIRADVFDMNVISLENDEAGTLGCAIMAAIADGAVPNIDTAIEKMVRIKKIFRPRMQMVEYYNERFEKYERLYEQMHGFL